MKKGRFFAAVFLILLLAPCTKGYDADFAAPLDRLESALPDAREALESAGNGDFSAALGGIWEKLGALVQNELASLVRGPAAVFAVCVLCALVRAFTGGEARTAAFCGAAGILAVGLGSLGGGMAEGKACLEALSAFGNTLLPTLCAAQIMAGGMGTAGTLYTAGAFVCGVVLSAVSACLAPLVYGFTALSAAQCLSGNDGFGRLGKLWKSGTIFVLKLLLGAFTGFLAISGVLSGAANAAAVKSAKLASGAVPLIGSALSDAAETVVAGAFAVKSVVGAAGLVGILAISAAPFARMALACILYKAAAILSAMTGAGETAAFAENLADAFVLLLALCAACTLAVILCVFMAILGAAGL